MRNIKDYKGENIFITTDSEEEFIKLIPLLNTVGRGWRPSHWSSLLQGRGYKYISIQDDCFRDRATGPIIPAREFLEAEISNTYSIY